MPMVPQSPRVGLTSPRPEGEVAHGGLHGLDADRGEELQREARVLEELDAPPGDQLLLLDEVEMGRGPGLQLCTAHT